jgi:hypothetical protein
MRKRPVPPVDASSSVPEARLRDRLEIVRFGTAADLQKALGLFRDVSSSDIHFTFRKDFPADIAVTNTATVRALRAHGLAFEWLTENI